MASKYETQIHALQEIAEDDTPPIATLSVSILLKYLQLADALETRQDIFQFVEGQLDTDRRRLTLFIGEQFLISTDFKQELSIEPRTSGGDNFLLYNTDMENGVRGNPLSDVAVDLRRGSVTPSLSSQTEQRLTAMLTRTQEYYDQWMELLTFPIISRSIPFPVEEIRNIRHNPS